MESTLEKTLPSLLDTPFDRWAEVVSSLGEKPYRARQLAAWVFEKRAEDFGEMSDLPEAFQRALSERYRLRTLRVVRQETSGLDGTKRFTFLTSDGKSFASVFLPAKSGTAGARASLCLSTQVGCAWGCVFCASGRVKFTRNLRASEILEQVLIVEKEERKKLDSLLFMGMGEPLANYENVLAALRIIRSKEGLWFGARHVTVSTCGLVPQIKRIIKEGPKVNLAVSLHAVDEEKRARLLPKSSRWSVKELLEVSRRFVEEVGENHLTFEYILLDGVNDSQREAKRLGNFLRGKRGVLVNLIPYNPVPELPYRRPRPESVEAFQKILSDRGVLVRIRKPQGVDIGAGCGQLGEASS